MSLVLTLYISPYIFYPQFPQYPTTTIINLIFNEYIHSNTIKKRVIQEQIILRDNAIEQSDLLMEYKKLFVRHSSHHYAFQNQKPGSLSATDTKSKKNGTGLLSIFTSFLDEPLSKIGSARTSGDHLIIELVLHLIRNLLSITPINNFGSTEKSQHASQLHRDLLVVMKEELVLDVLVCVGQEIERRENSGYNLLLMEIMSYLLRGQVRSHIIWGIYIVYANTESLYIWLIYHDSSSFFYRTQPMLHSQLSSLPCHPSRPQCLLPTTTRRRHLPNLELSSAVQPPEQTCQVVPTLSSPSFKLIVIRYSSRPPLVILTSVGLYQLPSQTGSKATSLQVLTSKRRRPAVPRAAPRTVIRVPMVAWDNQHDARTRRPKSL